MRVPGRRSIGTGGAPSHSLLDSQLNNSLAESPRHRFVCYMIHRYLRHFSALHESDVRTLPRLPERST